MRAARKWRRYKRFMHVFSVLLILGTLAFSVFRFAPVFTRFLQSVEDLGLSFVRFCLIYIEKEHLITSRVSEIPEGMDTILPLTLEEFKLFLARFWALFKNEANFKAYCTKLLIILGDAAEVIIYVGPPFSVFIVAICVNYSIVEKRDKKEEEEAEKEKEPLELDSPLLKLWRVVRRYTTRLLNIFAKIYGRFLKQKRVYCWILGLLWAYNLNLLTIVFEAVAWFFWAGSTLEMSSLLNIFVQIAKFAVDFSVPIFFIPKWAWWVIIYKIIDVCRQKVGIKRIEKYIEKDEEYIAQHPGALFVVGKQRSKKTSLLVMLKHIFERRFRKKAKEKFAERDKQFPFFPWQTIEKTVESCRENGTFIVFEDMEIFTDEIRQAWKERRILPYKEKRDHLLEKYGFNIDYFIEYAKNGYALSYDNGSTEVSIFEAIERYSQLYYIYSQPSTLDVANFSIREDFTFKNYGNFPIFDGDLIRTTKDSKGNTQYSHIIPYDAFRPKMAFNEATRYDVMIEYGIGVMTEASKERKNRYTRQQGKEEDKEKNLVNQDNDGFDLDTKVRGHVATIDNFDFWVWLMDDQDANAMGSDTRKVTTELMIKHTSDAKNVLPLCTLDEAIYTAVSWVRDKFHYFVKNRKYQNTLLDYVLNVIHQPFFQHIDYIRKKYGVHTVTVKTSDMQDEELLSEADKLYITVGTTYNDKFATDSCRTYYRHRARKAKVSLHGRVQYQDKHPTIEEYEKQDSFMHKDMSGLDLRKSNTKTKLEVTTVQAPPAAQEATTISAPEVAPEQTEAPKKRGRGRPPKSQA